MSSDDDPFVEFVSSCKATHDALQKMPVKYGDFIRACTENTSNSIRMFVYFK